MQFDKDHKLTIDDARDYFHNHISDECVQTLLVNLKDYGPNTISDLGINILDVFEISPQKFQIYYDIPYSFHSSCKGLSSQGEYEVHVNFTMDVESIHFDIIPSSSDIRHDEV